MVPRNLTEQQQDSQLSICADLLEQVEADPELMDQVITGDESWFFQCDPETKCQSLECRSEGYQGQRKHLCPSQKWNACLCASLIPWVLLTKSRFLLDRQSVSITTQKFLKGYEEGHAGSSQNCKKPDPSPRQCASPRSTLCSTVFDIQMHYGDAAVSLLTWFHTLRLLFISKSKIGSERTQFWFNRRHLEGCNTGLKWHPTRCSLGML